MKSPLTTRYGLKWNPFSPEIPTDACLVTPAVKNFCWRVEHLAREGGFALITGESGTGKSVALRILVDRLAAHRDLAVGILTRPQCSVQDFYRELGALFGVQLSPHNRWAGAKVLRERWERHIDTELIRPILIVDEAQEMHPTVLGELRLLCSARLDSRTLLTVVLCGDKRLPEKFRHPDLVALGSRIRVRLTMAHATPKELLGYLDHGLQEAGNSHLMTAELMETLCEHAAGNLRVLMTMSGELLDVAVQREVDRLDEKLFLETLTPPPPRKRGKPTRTS
jgi:type II secretory pathway predicted ATPase ExeA